MMTDTPHDSASASTTHDACSPAVTTAPDEKRKPSKRSARSSRALKLAGAVACVLVTVVAWIAMAQILQLLQLGGATYPWFEVWVVHDLYILFALPIGYYWVRDRLRRARGGRTQQTEAPAPAADADASAQGKTVFTWKKWLWVGFWMSMLFFFVEYSWYLSLPRTSISVNTAIYNSSPAFVFVFSIFLIRDKINVCKILALIVSIAGVVIVAVCTGTSSSTTGSGSSADDGLSTGDLVLGYVMLVLSTITYALYGVLYNKYCVDPADPLSFKNTFAFTASLGVSNILFFWIGIPILDKAGPERLDPKPSGSTIGILIGVGALAAAFQVFTQMAILLSSPLFVAVTQLLTIPLGIATDAVINHYVMPAGGFGGIALIVVGFVLINAGELYSAFVRQRTKTPSTWEKWLIVGRPLFPEKATENCKKGSPPTSEDIALDHVPVANI
eukprot:m51a1_g2742 hypothetical protein (444) ;mRNA; f:926846-928481